MKPIKSNKLFINLAVIALLSFSAVSCEKPEGKGGKATVTGKVYAYDFDNTQNYMLSKGYSADERVYITYGTSNSIGDDVRTSADGSFEFKYLNKGRYKIFVNSLDTSIKVKGNDSYKPVFREFEIKDAKQTIKLEDININK
jgi:hypothetical protein